MNKTERYLSQIPMFASLPQETIQTLAAGLAEVTAPAGTVLFHEGEAGNSLYIVIEGEVDVVKAKGTPEEQIIGTRRPGEFVGEMSLLNPDGLRTAAVITRAPTRLLEIKRADFDALLYRQPVLAYQLVRVLSLRLSESHNLAIHDLHQKNQELSKAYEALKSAQAQIIEKEKLERELQVAHRIQLSLLPLVPPKLDGYGFSARLHPARAVGGDLFDFIPLDRDRVGIVIGDVTDKGVPAALFMAQTHALVHAEAARSADPVKTLQRVNQHLLVMNGEGLFATLVYGILDRRTQELRYARAGHEAPLLCEPDCSITRLPYGPGQPLGLFPSPAIDEQVVTLSPGRTLLLYTDGATDVRDPNMEIFGFERLVSRLGILGDKPVDELVDRLLGDLVAFQSSAPQEDDITLVAVRAEPVHPPDSAGD